LIHFRIEAQKEGGHVHVQWRGANDPQATHGLNGELTYSSDEWNALVAILRRFPALFQVNETKPTEATR